MPVKKEGSMKDQLVVWLITGSVTLAVAGIVYAHGSFISVESYNRDQNRIEFYLKDISSRLTGIERKLSQ